MIGKLADQEINEFLSNEILGRIGCYSNGRVFVVPVNYGYDGKNIYAHSKDGMKIEMMRENPEVCFEVDFSDETGGWKSVIAWGQFEELTTIRRQRAAMKVFSAQMARCIADPKGMPSHGFVKGEDRINDPFKSVVFKIRISEVTGRYQKR